MRYSGIFLLILTILVAASFTWLHNKWRAKEIFISELDTSKVDYYLSDFSLYATDAEGNNRFVIAGEHLVHQRKNKKSEIYKPTIRVNTKSDTLTIIASKGEQNQAGDIKLTGKVIIHKPESAETVGFELMTSDLNFSPTSQLVNTDAKVIMETTDGSTISAIGMSENLNTHITRLKSNVHAEYTPPVESNTIHETPHEVIHDTIHEN